MIIDHSLSLALPFPLGEESEGGVAKEDSNDDGGGMDGMDKAVDGKEVQDQQEEDEEEEEERSSEVVLA